MLKKPDPQDGKIKLGVQITPFKEIYDEYQKSNGKIILRKLHARHGIFTNKNYQKFIRSFMINLMILTSMIGYKK